LSSFKKVHFKLLIPELTPSRGWKTSLVWNCHATCGHRKTNIFKSSLWSKQATDDIADLNGKRRTTKIKEQMKLEKQYVTCMKYGGRTHLWSSNRLFWSLSSSSNSSDELPCCVHGSYVDGWQRNGEGEERQMMKGDNNRENVMK
jgi:hypothetical protein